MGKKNTKLSNAAHIKRHTEGTSNELSFSVLDAAKNRADAEEGKDSRVKTPHFGGIAILSWRPGKKKTLPTPIKDDTLPLTSNAIVGVSPAKSNAGDFGLSGTAGIPKQNASAASLSTSLASTYASSEEEIGRRKARRRNRRILVSTLVSVVLVALIGGGGYVLYTEISNHQTQVSLLDRSLEKIAETDETALAIDQVVNTWSDDNSIESLTKLIEDIPPTITQLDDAEALAQEATQSMRDSSDKEAANQALTAIEARKAMLYRSESLLLAEIEAKKGIEKLTETWELVLEADGVSREAAALVTETTPENVTASKEKTFEALAMFEEITLLLDEIAASSLDPDIQILQDYTAKRIEALRHAIASDEAILAQDRQTAQSENDAYNAADAEASILAKDIPADLTQPIRDAFETQTKKIKEEYLQLRFNASTADAFLRDYLGT